MSVPPEYFSRIIREVDFPLLQTKRVVVAGVGQVGSKIAAELAHAAIGHLRFIDHDTLETSNLFRHVLPAEYVESPRSWNKADGLAVYLAAQVAGLETESVPSRIGHSRSVPDDLLDSWLADADLIIGSTDDPEAQLRIGRRALRLEIPAIFPALYPHDNGGEVIVQLDNELPCFCCAAGLFRTQAPQLEGVGGLSFFGLPVIVTAIKLSLAILEPGSEYAKLITPVRSEPPHQFFELDRSNVLESRPLAWLTDCPSCDGGPCEAPDELLWEESPQFPMLPSSPSDQELWENRSTGIRTVFTSREEHQPPHHQQADLPPVTPDSPLWHAIPDQPQAAAPAATVPGKKLSEIAYKLVFLGLPIGIMALVVPAYNAHPSPFLDVVSVVCFFWLIAGIAGLFIEWG